jgi:hypothetical protein
MAGSAEYQYDLFISYSPEDGDWVDTWLLPRLERAGLRVAIDYRDFTVGMPRVANIEQAIDRSRRTIVVLTPAWLESEWNAFEALLLRTKDPAARQRRLLPVLLKPCDDLPEAVAVLESVDLTVEKRWEAEIRRLIRDVKDTIPVPLPWREGRPGDLRQWQAWVIRYRRQLRRGVVVAFFVWLALSMLLQLFPFQSREAWVSLGLDVPHGTQLMDAGDVLLVGGSNKERLCSQTELGLWRSLNQGADWSPMYAPLEFTDPDGGGCLLADVQGFAGDGTRIYAATSDVGLLRSDDAGAGWTKTGDLEVPRPNLIAVAVDPGDVDRVYVAHVTGGLFRSDDGGDTWRRLDMQSSDVACEQGVPLTGNLVVRALVVTGDHVVVGTGDPYVLDEQDVPGGIYLSADGGTCWRQRTEAGRRYQYLDLAYASATDHLLVLRYDWGQEPNEEANEVLRLDLLALDSSPQLLWQTQRAARAVVVSGDFWYAVTQFGQVVRGPVLGTAPPEELSSFLLPCVLSCDVALAPGPTPAPPLLLIGRWGSFGKVLRWQQAPWWHRVWP